MRLIWSQYAAFGKVVSGMEYIDKIVNEKRSPMDKPLTPQVIVSAEVDTFGATFTVQKA